MRAGGGDPRSGEIPRWLGNLDSNQDKQSQSLLCYRYTIPQEADNSANQQRRSGGQDHIPLPVRSFYEHALYCQHSVAANLPDSAGPT